MILIHRDMIERFAPKLETKGGFLSKTAMKKAKALYVTRSLFNRVEIARRKVE